MDSYEADPYEQLLKPWIDDELDAIRSEEVERHLEHCRGCRSAVADFRTISDRVRAVADASAPRVDPAAIHVRASLLEREEATAIRRLKRLAAAAVVLLGFCVGTLVVSPDSRSVNDSTADPSLERDTMMTLALSDSAEEGEF